MTIKPDKHHISSGFTDSLDRLIKVHNETTDLTLAIMRSNNGNMYTLDFLILAALSRSQSNIHGFHKLIELGNYFGATPFLRMQLDSVLRLFAITLVDNRQEIVQKVF